MWTCPKCGREFKRTGQDHYCGKAPVTVDEYISRQDESVQPTLVCLKNAINDAIPEAVETIAWSMPTWKGNDHIIQFAVNKKHIGVYIGEDAAAHFGDRLKGYEIYKGGIRVKYDQEMPYGLIAEIAKWCCEMDRMS